MPRSRRLASLVSLAFFVLLVVVSCGEPTSPPPEAEPDAETPEAEPVGPEGGTAAASDGAATLAVPAGALAEPVQITIAPAAVTSMLDLVPPEAYDPDLGTVFGVVPIQGTIWDLQPDGLQFGAPATVVLRYEPSALPEGVSEEDLAVFLVDGTFEELPSIVDTDAHTITAEIAHFSFMFTAPQSGLRVDLELTSLSASMDPRVGESVAYTAEVRNNGPGAALAASVLYEATGNLALGPVNDSCTALSEPSSGELVLSCAVPPLSVGGQAAAPEIRIVPRQSGEPVTVRATVVSAADDTDLNPENDSQQIGHVVGGEGATVDLQAGQPRLSTASDPRVGGLMEVIGRVDNLGPGTSSGGTLRLEAIGDVEIGEVPSACTEIEAVAPVAAAIECPVEPLAQHDLAGIGPLRITALSAGEVEAVATVTPAPQDTDVDPENDVNRRTFEIASTFLVDLEPVSPIFVDGVRTPGSPLSARVRVGNYSPPSNGGTVVYEAFGDVTLGDLAEGCTEYPNPSGVAVECAFDAFPGYVNDTRGPDGGTVRGWVGPFQVIPQSVGSVTFAATTVPIAGDTDTNPDNDRIELQIEIHTGESSSVERRVDLEFAGVVSPGPAGVDEAVGMVAQGS